MGEVLSEPPLFLEKELGSAEALLDELSPHRWGRLWRYHRHEHHWLFRGQSDATWTLMPAAFRPGATWRLVAAQVGDPRYTQLQHREREHEDVLNFAATTDTHGFPLFGDSPTLRERALTPDELRSPMFPPLEFRGFYALAQHYGVATRLLDWTTLPLVAAYFAAVDVAELCANDVKRRPGRAGAKPAERFAVWALSSDCLRSRPLTEHVSLVTASASHIPNLYAQRGRFTLVRSGAINPDSSDPEDLPTLDRLISEWPGDLWRPPVLYKFTVPSTEARRLLFWLATAYGITAASAYPGPRGVYKSLVERTWFQIPPTPNDLVDDE